MNKWKLYPHWFIRTVRNGRIRFAGADWEPRYLTEGRFDGRRYMFGSYADYEQRPARSAILDFLALWGSAVSTARLKEIRAPSEEEIDAVFENEDEKLTVHEDGHLYWYWWDRVRDA